MKTYSTDVEDMIYARKWELVKQFGSLAKRSGAMTTADGLTLRRMAIEQLESNDDPRVCAEHRRILLHL